MKAGGGKALQIALIGNPNSGKSTVFNQLTGLRQKTGNFPGVTVDIHKGKIQLADGTEVVLIDFPGAYSVYPTSSDEKLVAAILTDPGGPHYPDGILYVADAAHLEKHLLLLTQLMDLQLPVVLALNLMDGADEDGTVVDARQLSKLLGIPVVSINGRTGANLSDVLNELQNLMRNPTASARRPIYQLTNQEKQVAEAVQQNLGVALPYRALLLAHHCAWLPFLSDEDRHTLAAINQTKAFHSLRAQVDETLARYDHFTPLVEQVVHKPGNTPHSMTDRIDSVLTHALWGPLVFAGVMLLVFQAIFDWSSVPMDFIENQFAALSGWLHEHLPAHWTTDLLTDGILAGLSGILVFVPQIAILFFLIALLEEVGYMARVVFMFDKSMRRFGMNGRSVVALISSGACAVPAIMSARTISNWKERLITILVTPFISCSARLPVYSVLIGLAVPADRVLGIFNLQGITFAGMYLLGVVAALGSGWLMKKYLHSREPSFLALELPVYRVPHWKNVGLTVWEKTKAFVEGAGKIILLISIVLWALASYGPADDMQAANARAEQTAVAQSLDDAAKADLTAAYRLEASWAGQLGKFIEPAIRPLGYDWKIGIALITSFAAREVFVATMSTIYSIGSTDDEALLREKMRHARFSGSAEPVYTLATAMSLLVFYALAMQCMSTLAVVQRETGSWKWALLQFLAMSGLAYLFAFLVYRLFL